MSIFGNSKKIPELISKIILLTKDFNVLKLNLKGKFKSVNDELDSHLDSINQNSNEIQTNYEYTAELESRIEKLSEKVDELQMQLNPHINSYQYTNGPLSKKEQDFFMNLYTIEDRIPMVELAKTAGLTLELCEMMICSLENKNIPIIKQVVDGKLYLSLEYTFKDLQARKNVLKIDNTFVPTAILSQ